MKSQWKLVRTTWESLGFVKPPITKVKKNKKGKGSYSRKNKIGKGE